MANFHLLVQPSPIFTDLEASARPAESSDLSILVAEVPIRYTVGDLRQFVELAESGTYDQTGRLVEPGQLEILLDQLARREVRLAAIRDAKAELEARAAERFAREQTEYEAKVKAREDKQKRTGKKPRGKPPTPPTGGPRAKDQVNLTDPDSRIMPESGGGFEQSYNAQAAVDTGSMVEQIGIVRGAKRGPVDDCRQQLEDVSVRFRL